jgi:hypothetical protein
MDGMARMHIQARGPSQGIAPLDVQLAPTGEVEGFTIGE